MQLSISLPSRLSTAAAAAALAITAAGTIAFAGAAHAAVCLPTTDGHTAAVVLAGTSSVTGQTIDATGCFYGVYVSPGADATVSGNTISGYQKAGVFVDGRSAPTSATVTDNTVDGAGPDAVYAQNGIEFWGANASGLVRGNTIDGHWYTGADWTATGILLFDVQANQIKTSQNRFIDNQRNLALVTSSSCENQLGGAYDGLC